MSSRLIINLLAYLGLIPFVAGAYLTVVGKVLFGLDAGYFFVSYSAIILTFLGGVLWGYGLTIAGDARRKLLLLLSNLFALLAWFSLLASGTAYHFSVLSLMLGYGFVLLSEKRLVDHGQLEFTWPYAKMRQVLSALVVGCHAVVLLVL